MRPTFLFLLSLLLAGCAVTASGPNVREEFAPTGALRAGVNFGNPVIAQRDPAGGNPRGVGPDLARELARRLGVPIKYVVYEAAGKMADGLKNGECDIVFLAADPDRANEIAFAQPYVVIEGTYLVRKDSPLRRIEDVDRDGVKIVVGAKSAYDLYLTREIRHAKLTRGAGGVGYLEDWRKGGFDAAAGVRQALVAEAKRDPNVRVLDGHFMAILQSAGVPKQRQASAKYLDAFVGEMKSSGFVRAALDRSGNADVAIP